MEGQRAYHQFFAFFILAFANRAEIILTSTAIKNFSKPNEQKHDE